MSDTNLIETAINNYNENLEEEDDQSIRSCNVSYVLRTERKDQEIRNREAIKESPASPR